MGEIVKKHTARPFLKWAGGKRQILKHIIPALAPAFEGSEKVTYAEPFVGSGAVFFEVMQKFPDKINRVIINDVNHDLITSWRVVRDHPQELIEKLNQLKSTYTKKDESAKKHYFGEIRANFNKRNHTITEHAAMLIFLNKTCFNGLYRVNSKNQFNVPHGKYRNPAIFEEQALLSASELLKDVEIMNVDYEKLLPAMPYEEHVVWYFDPPYRPISKSSAFVSYAAAAFDDDEQKRLKAFCDILHKKKHSWVLSNSDPKNTVPEDTFFDELFSDYNLERISARRSINSKGTGRGALTELLITNI